MTGLDARSDVILEIAALVTDDDLQIVASGPDLVIHQPPEALIGLDQVVVDMHTSNGLFEQVAASTVGLEEAGDAVLNFLRDHIGQPGSAPMCGNSIGTDRRFLAHYLPEIDNFLHYRSIDVSTIKELAKRWQPEVYQSAPEKSKPHRALDDIKESINELSWYRRAGFVGGTTATATADT